MKHPRTRSERRFARQVWRDRRRRVMMTWCGYKDGKEDPTENTMWFHSGKQCEAHGNRCMHSMIERWERHREVKGLRSEKFGALAQLG